MTGAPQLRPAAGWLVRRLAELGSDAGTVLGSGRRPPGAARVVPPRRLRARVGVPAAGDYIEGGRQALVELERAPTPRRLTDVTPLLDFGSGPGRILSHLSPSPARQRVGVDVDAAAISWARAHLDGARFELCAARPPLPFADRSFECIYSISVFSHLDESAQDAWLAELARILAPAGTALLSVHGPTAFAAFASGAVATTWCDPAAFRTRGPLGGGEMLAVPYRCSRWSRGDLPGVGKGYGLAFHGPDYIAERWGAFLEIEAIIPRAISGWQDLVVARRQVQPV